MSEAEVDDYVVDGHDAATPEPAATPTDPPALTGEPSQGTGRDDAADSDAETPDQAPADETPEDKRTRERDESGRFKKNDPHKRISELTYKHREAERQLEQERAERTRLAQELEGYRKGQTAPAPVPQADKFPDYGEWVAQAGNADKPYEEYVDARTDWRFEQRVAEQRQQAREQRQAEHAENYQARLTAFRKATPDYDEAIRQGAHAKTSRLMEAAILAAENGPELVYYLLKHPDEATDLAHQSAHLDPTDDASLLLMQRTLALTLRANGATSGSPSKATPRTTAAAPIRPVGTTATTSDRPPGDDASFEAHAAYWDAKERQDRSSRR